MKKIKPAYIGILLIAIMFGSTFAYGVIQAVSTSPPSQNQQTIEVPSGIIDYELSASQQYELLGRGYTIMNYKYNFACEKCSEERSTLNQIVQAREFSGQVVLQELLSDNAGNLTIVSAYGEEMLSNFNVTDVVDSLCRLAVSPPTECVILQLTKSQPPTSNATTTNSTE